ncbi:MAG: S8 family serine peptidase [Anaerolineae bacterium]|nr:S8 family serine peptidase [Anaerolineae bacterium]
MRRRITLLCLLLLALILALPVAAQGPTPPLDKDAEAKITPTLRAALAKDGRAEFLVRLREQADLRGAAALSDRASKARFVYDQVRDTARKTQPGVAADVVALGGQARSFALVNALLVTGDAAVLDRLARRGDVAQLELNVQFKGVQSAPGEGLAPAVGTPWGITKVQAPPVWSQYTRGGGIVVASADTGVDWTHPALQPKYRGWNGTSADHSLSWHDAIENQAVPLDDNGHGTHTTGTMLGSEGGNNVGVAPDAKWIGCRNMDHGVGTPARYLDCMEFFLAPFPPTGNFIDDGHPGLGADVINNSWGCPTDEGCYPQTITEAIRALRAAGIMFVASAGNDGPQCSTVIDPPGLVDDTFTVGAFSESGSIAGFSSRGPVTVDGSNRSKPDITAPGVNVISSIRGGGYGSNQGTSMASPHVAGVVALVWAAVPALKGQIEATEALLRTTATQRTDAQCGTTAGGRANHVWGWGEVNALAAVEAALASSAISGTVRSAATAQPLTSAQVNLTGPGALAVTVTTDAQGEYHFRGPAGTYTLTVAAFGYQPTNAELALGASPITQDFSLASAQEFTVSGFVRQAGINTPVRASITVDGSSRRTTTAANGSFSLMLPAGSYTLRAEAMGYKTGVATFNVNGLTTQDFSLALAAPILVVDDDEGKDLETLYTGALTSLGRQFDVYEVRDTGSGPTDEVLDNYCLVIWVVGGPRHRIRTSDYQALKAYLDQGGRLLLSEPGAASTDFHTAYLHAALTSGSTALTLLGSGPFSGAFGYFTDNRADAGAPMTLVGEGQPAFTWAGQPTYGGVVYSGAYKALYLSFGLQNIGLTSRTAFLNQLLNWFGCPRCRLPGDVDYSGQVDVVDIIRITQALGQTIGQAGYRRQLDRNLDAVIDAADMDAVAANWAAKCQ